jgi:Holliday junction resolvase RusA-like endonuclease
VPDNRKRDIDNCLKSLLDALTKCQLWHDDVLIDQIFLYRGVKLSPSGLCFIRVSEAGPIIPEGMTTF